jgi:hypothetical protein
MMNNMLKKSKIGALEFAITLAIAIMALMPARASAATLSIQVSGHNLIDQNGNTVFFHGVDRSDSAYACVSSGGVFIGPTNQASVSAMVSWHINAVRLSLNEDCWLGINGVNSAYSGANYQSAIVNYASLLESNGIYVDLVLIWNAPGSYLADSQEPEADNDHAPAFWSSVASAFANDHGTLFELYNEPYANYNGSEATGMTWSCWANGGCSVACDQVTAGGTCPSGYSYQVAGMGPLIKDIRNQEGSGWHHPVILGGEGCSNDLTGWLANLPADSAQQEVAGYHWYNDDAGNCVMPTSNSCWGNLATIAASYPLIGTEFGQLDCSWNSNVQNFLSFMQSNSSGYEAWVWNPGASCPAEPALVSNWSGSPTGYGQDYESYLLSNFSATNPPTGGGTSPGSGSTAVQITSPGNNASVSGNVSINATTGSSELWYWNVYVDQVLIGSVATLPTTWNSTTVANGSHTIEVASHSENPGGAVIGSSTVTVNVQNGGVVISSPANGGTVSGNVTINATTSNSELWYWTVSVDGTAIGSYSTLPTTWNSTSVADGTHTIQVASHSENPNGVVLGTATVTVNVEN